MNRQDNGNMENNDLEHPVFLYDNDSEDHAERLAYFLQNALANAVYPEMSNDFPRTDMFDVCTCTLDSLANLLEKFGGHVEAELLRNKWASPNLRNPDLIRILLLEHMSYKTPAGLRRLVKALWPESIKGLDIILQNNNSVQVIVRLANLKTYIEWYHEKPSKYRRFESYVRSHIPLSVKSVSFSYRYLLENRKIKIGTDYVGAAEYLLTGDII